MYAAGRHHDNNAKQERGAEGRGAEGRAGDAGCLNATSPETDEMQDGDSLQKHNAAAVKCKRVSLSVNRTLESQR